MKEQKLLKLTGYYLKDRAKIIALVLLLILTQLAVCAVFRELSEALLYADVISAFLFLCIGAVDYLGYIKKRKQLYEVLLNLDTHLSALPEKSSTLEEEYQELLKYLDDKRFLILSETRQHTTELNDYYTIWVHQIKTPIAAMRLILQGEEGSQSRLILEQELFRVEQYAEMALHYIRLGSMSSDLLLEECDLGIIVKQALKKYAINFSSKKLSLALEEFSVIVVTDDKWLTFIIEQALSNSIKYTREGGIRIYLSRTEKCIEKQDNLMLVIEDTGIGISQEDLPRIFEKGFTGYNGHMDKKSTGIGLYLCKQIADKLGYKIEVISDVGKGTKFIICI
jgi:signal transduction histidine kinase